MKRKRETEMVDEEAWKIVDEAERDMVTSPFDVSKDERSLFSINLLFLQILVLLRVNASS